MNNLWQRKKEKDPTQKQELYKKTTKCHNALTCLHV